MDLDLEKDSGNLVTQQSNFVCRLDLICILDIGLMCFLILAMFRIHKEAQADPACVDLCSKCPFKVPGFSSTTGTYHLHFHCGMNFVEWIFLLIVAVVEKKLILWLL